MWKDPIVQEIRKIREANAVKFNYDIKTIIKEAQKRQKESNHRVVSFIIKKQKAS